MPTGSFFEFHKIIRMLTMPGQSPRNGQRTITWPAMLLDMLTCKGTQAASL